MSAEATHLGVHEYQRTYKGAVLTTFISVLALISTSLAFLLTNEIVLDSVTNPSETQIISSGGSAIGDLLALPAVIVGFTLSILSLLISAVRLRHFKSSKKALFNLFALLISLFGVILAIYVYGRI